MTAKLADIFGPHMVLQADQPLPLWGTADPGSDVEVRFRGMTPSTTADDAGRWRLTLPAQTPGGPDVLHVNNAAIDDVLIGEVWLCSGQSNMQWTVEQSADAEAEIAGAALPLVRHYAVSCEATASPRQDAGGTWRPATPEHVARFSGVAYSLGRKLHQRLGVPIGLVNCSWGGSPIEAWLSADALDAAGLTEQAEATREALAELPARQAREKVDTGPRYGQYQFHHTPGALDAGMIGPLGHLSVRGFAWYQGESNADRPHLYADQLCTLIDSWRGTFNGDRHPALVVQLPNFIPPEADRDWVAFRAAQQEACDRLDDAHLAVTLDLGEADDIHPANKRGVGERLAALALRYVYDREIPAQGPTLAAAHREGDAVVLTFDPATGPLELRGNPDEQANAFELVTPDGQAHPAVPTITDGLSLSLTADGVTAPTAVRYAHHTNPPCVLFNTAGLPAAPFVQAV